MRHVGRWVAGAAGVYALLCRFWPGFARAALDGFALPVMNWLHRLTAAVPFPVVEPLAIGLMAVLLISMMKAAITRRVRALGGVAWTAIMIAVLLIILWGPAMAQPVEAAPIPTVRQLERLCVQLIDRLNDVDWDGIDAVACLRRAGEVAGMSNRVVKAARYPEWMRACRCAGLFVPLTGEALVDADAPTALVPFTAVHELTHLSGVADEGAANLLAWERCVAAGGDFAASARLWALRYAMGLLEEAEYVLCRRVETKMDAALSRVYREAGGGIAPASPAPFSLTRGDYAALAKHLAARL